LINIEKSWQILKISKNLTVLIYLNSLDENLDWKVSILKILTKKKKSCLDTKENLDSFQKYVSSSLHEWKSRSRLLSTVETPRLTWSFFWSHEKWHFQCHDYSFDLLKNVTFDLLKFDLLNPAHLKHNFTCLFFRSSTESSGLGSRGSSP
jgi:hypothetical protein